MMNWYAIYTKPKAEDTVSEKLRQAGLEVYNPKLKSRKYIRSSYRDVVEPLFPCYLFAKYESDKYHWMITYTRGVKKIVGNKSDPWPVSGDIIDYMRNSEKEGFISLSNEEISAGDTVEIADGPLSGLIGIFQQFVKGSERALLLLNAIGYQAKVIVERASLIKVC